MYSFRDGHLVHFKYSSATALLLTRIADFKGQQAAWERKLPEVLEALQQDAVIRSAEASNSMEGIVARRDRLIQLMDAHVFPESRAEAEIAGYRDVLNVIHASSAEIVVWPEVIQHLHGMLMKYVAGIGSEWKSTDSRIEALLPTGEVIIGFDPIPACQTPEVMNELCLLVHHQKAQGNVPDLVLIAAFALDFSCIHPFSDGNGRMARLLILLLLDHCGYHVGRYISIEQAMEETQEQYYETLYLSSRGWHEGEHDLTLWLDYFLSVLLRCYTHLADLAGTVQDGRLAGSKMDVTTDF